MNMIIYNVGKSVIWNDNRIWYGINKRKLTKAIRQLQQIETMTINNGKLHIKDVKGKEVKIKLDTTYKTFNPQRFNTVIETIQNNINKSTLEIPYNVFINAVKYIVPFLAEDEKTREEDKLRSIIHVDINDDTITIVGGDGYRLSIYKINNTNKITGTFNFPHIYFPLKSYIYELLNSSDKVKLITIEDISFDDIRFNRYYTLSCIASTDVFIVSLNSSKPSYINYNNIMRSVLANNICKFYIDLTKTRNILKTALELSKEDPFKLNDIVSLQYHEKYLYITFKVYTGNDEIEGSEYFDINNVSGDIEYLGVEPLDINPKFLLSFIDNVLNKNDQKVRVGIYKNDDGIPITMTIEKDNLLHIIMGILKRKIIYYTLLWEY